MITCGHCVHYQPYRNPATGRICPSQDARCGWKPPDIKWALAYWTDAWRSPSPRPIPIFRDKPADKCPCWESAKDDKPEPRPDDSIFE